MHFGVRQRAVLRRVPSGRQRFGAPCGRIEVMARRGPLPALALGVSRQVRATLSDCVGPFDSGQHILEVQEQPQLKARYRHHGFERPLERRCLHRRDLCHRAGISVPRYAGDDRGEGALPADESRLFPDCRNPDAWRRRGFKGDAALVRRQTSQLSWPWHENELRANVISSGRREESLIAPKSSGPLTAPFVCTQLTLDRCVRTHDAC